MMGQKAISLHRDNKAVLFNSKVVLFNSSACETITTANNNNDETLAKCEPLTQKQSLAHCTEIKFKHTHVLTPQAENDSKTDHKQIQTTIGQTAQPTSHMQTHVHTYTDRQTDRQTPTTQQSSETMEE